MAYRFGPAHPISQSAREVGIEQIDRVLARFANGKDHGSAVHDARKALKRLRALLHLLKLAMPKSEFRRDQQRLKLIAQSLSGVRDVQAMLETIAKLEAYDGPVGGGPVAAALKSQLEAECADAEQHMSNSILTQARKMLKEVRRTFGGLQLQTDDFAVVALMLKEDYRKARHAFRRAYRVQEDEAFHDWRKYVQRHWRQLVLVASAWPKALRPHIALARDLSEILGEDHDLYMLSHRVIENGKALGRRREVDAYLALCRHRQDELRSLARHLGARLLAEKPASLAGRLITYWTTASEMDAPEFEDAAGDGDQLMASARGRR